MVRLEKFLPEKSATLINFRCLSGVRKHMPTSIRPRETAPGLACFGTLAEAVARACRERPGLLNRLILLRASDFHCLCLGIGRVGPDHLTAASLEGLLDQEPRKLLARILGDLGESKLDSLYRLLERLPNRYVEPRHYRALARIAAANLGMKIIGHDDVSVLEAIQFWCAVADADALTIAVAGVVYPDARSVMTYVHALKQAMSVGLLGMSEIELLASLEALHGRIALHAFLYRRLIKREAPLWPVQHPAFRQVREASRLWRPPAPVRWRRRLLEIVTGSVVLLEYLGGTSRDPVRPTPVILLDPGALSAGYEVFGATLDEFAAIESLIPALLPVGYPLALASLLQNTLADAEQIGFHLQARYHGQPRVEEPEPRGAADV